METLTAYTRKERDSVLDVQAVLVVISRRETSNDPPSVVIDLSKSHLQSVSPQHLWLPGAVMIEANLQEANLQEANLQKANLGGADLAGADLKDTYLKNTYLQGANLQGAYLQGAYLQGADLKNTYLQGANLRRAKNLGCRSLTHAIAWEYAFRDPELACGAEIPGPK